MLRMVRFVDVILDMGNDYYEAIGREQEMRDDWDYWHVMPWILAK